jgi:hypothetical protein
LVPADRPLWSSKKDLCDFFIVSITFVYFFYVISHSICVWDDEKGDNERVEWSRGLPSSSEQVGNVNILGPLQNDPKITQGAYGVHYDRLVVLKRQWDPGNVFCANHNIKPN